TNGGREGWGCSECLPYSTLFENYADFGEAPYHGRSGPIHIERSRPDSAVEESFIAACLELGHQPLADLNSPGGLGVGPLPRNIHNGARQSTLVTYLAEARGRPNLQVRGGAMVDRLLFDGDRGTGGVLADGEEIRA